DAPDGKVTWGDVGVVVRLGDERPNALQAHGFPDCLVPAVPLVLVLLLLVVAVERLGDQLDVGDPLHRRHAVPVGDDQPDGVTVVDGDGLAVHGVSEDGARFSGNVNTQA